jgi:hypothetical protein
MIGGREHERGREQQCLRRAGEHRHGKPPISFSHLLYVFLLGRHRPFGA